MNRVGMDRAGHGAGKGRRVAGAHTRRPGVRGNTLDAASFDMLIVRQWTKTLQGPFDWGEWPLAPYLLGVGVVRAAADRGAFARCASSSRAERLAWVCAMVACGRAARICGIDPSPMCEQSDGAQVVRADGALGWCCNVERNSPGGPKLHYWTHTSGLIEFEAVAAHGDAQNLALARTGDV
jgi:hypothetical protein